MQEATSIIEDDLLSAVAEGQTSVQHVDSYNRGFKSSNDQFCPLVTKEIRVRDDAEWYDHSGVLAQGAEKGREEVEKDRV